MNGHKVVKAWADARRRLSILGTKLAVLDLSYRHGNQNTPSIRRRHGVEPCVQLFHNSSGCSMAGWLVRCYVYQTAFGARCRYSCALIDDLRYPFCPCTRIYLSPPTLTTAYRRSRSHSDALTFVEGKQVYREPMISGIRNLNKSPPFAKVTVHAYNYPCGKLLHMERYLPLPADAVEPTFDQL
jgi:hypothetical protein